MGNKRIIWIAIAAAVAFICLGIVGVRTFVQAIYRERGCDWANIDNIEMHAALDIPGVDGCDCDFTVADNVKRAILTFDSSTDAVAYAQANKLVPSSGPYPPEFASMNGFPSNKRLYLRSANNYDSDYRLALDTESRKLWVFIRYKH